MSRPMDDNNVRVLKGLSGLTPAMERVTRDFWREIWEAIDKAADQGMTTAQVVGNLEVAKAAVTRSHFGDDDG